MTMLKEKIIMQAHGQATVWGTHVGVSRAHNSEGWRQHLRQWWAARQDAYRRARVAALTSCWDPHSETFRPLYAQMQPLKWRRRGLPSR